MANCENCSNEHDEKYGSGRFCCSKCARAFSTKNKRQEINEKVSNKLKGIKPKNPFKKGFDSRRLIHSSELWKRFNKNKLKNYPFKSLGRGYKKLRILIEQENTCFLCRIDPIWCEKKLVLQLDHINGDNKDNRRENLRMICPNCHSQTDTFCSKNRKPK